MRTKIKNTMTRLALLLLLIGLILPSGTPQKVEAAARTVSLRVYGKNVYVGASTKLKIRATSRSKIYYGTSNKNIATVNSRGTVTGKRAGTVRITVTAKRSGYRTAKKNVTIKIVKRNQKIGASNMTLTVGQGRTIPAKTKTGRSYKTSNKKVVTVNSKGYIKAVGAGTAKVTITAKASGMYNAASQTIVVKVSKKSVAPNKTSKPANPTIPNQKPSKPNAKPTVKPTAKPTVKPTAKPTVKPDTPIEPSIELKTALDEITSKDYMVFANWGDYKIIEDSRFDFVAEKDTKNAHKENTCIVTSSDPKIAGVTAAKDDSNNSSILNAYGNSYDGKSITLTFSLGSYTKNCQLKVIKRTNADLTKVPDEELLQYITDEKTYAQEVYRLINEYRVKMGRDPLVWENTYCLKSAVIAAGVDCFNGMRTIKASDFADHGASQIGYGATGYPKEAVEGWIASPIHRANILNSSAKTIGVAYFSVKFDDGVHKVFNGTSVVCTISFGSKERIDSLQNIIKQDHLNMLRTIVHSEEEYDRYVGWFYHPVGEATIQSADISEDAVFDSGSEDAVLMDGEKPVSPQ